MLIPWSSKGFGTQQLPRHYGRETYICVSKLGAIDSDNGLSPVRCQVIIWTNAGLCGGVLWVFMTSPSSMRVPDHCVRKGQHSTFDDSWTRSFLRLGEICRHVTISIINLSHMCAYSAILRLKIINNKSIKAIELSKIPRDIRARVALSEIIPRTDFRRGDFVQRSPISRSYLGYWAYRIYIGEWSDRYGYIYFFPRAGAGDYW